MFSPWSEAAQEKLRNIIIALWTVMFIAYMESSANISFNLFSFPLLLHPVFLVMVICWGVYLFFQGLSLLPVSKHTKRAMSDHSLFWLTLIPSISWLFWVIVALDATFPIIDPLVVPLFFTGVITAFYLFTDYIFEGRLSQRMGRIFMRLRSRLQREADGETFTGYGL